VYESLQHMAPLKISTLADTLTIILSYINLTFFYGQNL